MLMIVAFPDEAKFEMDSISMASSAHSGVLSIRDSDRNSDIETVLSESSIPSEHRVNYLLDEGWIIAPPPIFIAIRRDMYSPDEADPLENLLIEHPSMSVYNSAPVRRNRANNVLQRSPLENGARLPQDARVHQRQAHVAHMLAAKRDALELRATMRGQATKLKDSSKAMNRSKLARANKVHAGCGRGHTKTTSRKSRIASAPSGYNNNRKC